MTFILDQVALCVGYRENAFGESITEHTDEITKII